MRPVLFLAVWILAVTASPPLLAASPTPIRMPFRAPPAVLESSTLSAGGAPSGSAGFRLDGTMGQGMPVGTTASVNRSHCAGYWAFLCGVPGQIGIPDSPIAVNALLPNVPNPFSDGTSIGYSLAEAGPVEIAVYALTGQRVATLWSGAREPGTYRLVWNGTDDAGRRVASGIYFCRIRSNRFESVRKMLVSR